MTARLERDEGADLQEVWKRLAERYDIAQAYRAAWECAGECAG